MAENYGLPYSGSKSRIAHWVIDNLPRGRVLIDAFAGGCAITHRALLSQKWQTIRRWTDEDFAFAIQIPTGLITKGCCLYFLNATFNLGQK